MGADHVGVPYVWGQIMAVCPTYWAVMTPIMAVCRTYGAGMGADDGGVPYVWDSYGGRSWRCAVRMEKLRGPIITVCHTYGEVTRADNGGVAFVYGEVMLADHGGVPYIWGANWRCTIARVLRGTVCSILP